jgi:hypothetical protein
MDLRCEVCDEQGKWNPNWFAKHMKVHSDSNKRKRASGEFKMTLNTELIEVESEDSEFYSEE